MNPNAALYETDFYSWCLNTAALIRDGKWSDLDRAALAEEIEALAARDRREMRRRFKRLLTHLLKWQYQPSRRQTGHSWRSTIRNQRDELLGLFEQSPALGRQASEAIHKSYGGARPDAADQTRLPLATFPVTCPWTEAQVLDPDFWPDAPSAGGDPEFLYRTHSQGQGLPPELPVTLLDFDACPRCPVPVASCIRIDLQHQLASRQSLEVYSTNCKSLPQETR